MNKIIIGSSYLVLAAFILLVFAGCDMNMPFSGSDTSPSPAQTEPGRITVTPNFSPSNGINESDDVSGMVEGIRDFAEGTAVDLASVPEIVMAVQEKYPDVTITGISHAMHLDKQVYKVLFTDDNRTTHTVYVSPDGKEITEATEPENSQTPAGSQSPGSSSAPSPSANPSSSPSPSQSPAEEG